MESPASCRRQKPPGFGRFPTINYLFEMAKVTDSTYEGLVGAFELLLTYLVYLGAGYNPAPAHLKLVALQARLATLKSLLNDVSLAKAANDAAIATRAAWFDQLADLVTRVYNMLKVLSPKSPVMNAVKSLMNKLRGRRAAPAPTNPDGTPGNSNSSSQTRFVNKVDQVSDLINTLGQDPKYAPAAPPVGSTEPNLTLAGLGAFRDEMSARNAAVNGTEAPLTKARADRDKALFDPEDGLLAVVKQIKAYVKAMFGAKSAEFLQINGIRFKQLN
jgi:hypothetical protein